jgi:hypothetical protein
MQPAVETTGDYPQIAWMTIQRFDITIHVK